MRKYLLIAAALFGLVGAQAQAADSPVPSMTAASALAGSELLYCVQSAADRKCAASQVSAYIFGLMSGDATVNGTGTVTLATVNANVGTFGSTTNCATLTVNAKGLITSVSAATCAPAVGSITGMAAGVPAWLATPTSANLAAALTDETGSGAAVFGTAPTISSLNATTAMTLAFLTGSTQCVQVNTSGVVSGTGSACGGGGSGTVTSVAAGCGTSTGGSPITTTGTVSAAVTRRANATTSDTIVSTDCGNIVSESNASAIAGTIAQAGTAGFGAGTYFWICNINAGVFTLTPTTSTIGGAATLVIQAGTAAHPNCTGFQSDGTNYNLIDAVYGSGVAIAAGNALSAAGGLSSTIFHGTLTIPATAIGAGACGTAITVAATNVATTDVVTAGFAADPTATTGFLPTAMLTIVPYPTAGNVNAKVCNLTGSSITPTSTTINVSVVR